MALVINGTSIPTSGKVVCNGTSLKQLNIGGTKVWNSGIDLIAANNWTKTSSQDGFWGSSTSQPVSYTHLLMMAFPRQSSKVFKTS